MPLLYIIHIDKLAFLRVYELTIEKFKGNVTFYGVYIVTTWCQIILTGPKIIENLTIVVFWKTFKSYLLLPNNTVIAMHNWPVP